MSNSSQWFFKSSFRLIWAATLVTLTLAACGGGSGDSVPPAPSGAIQAQLQAPLSVVAGQAFSLDARSSAAGVSGGALKYFWDLGAAKAATAQIGHVYDVPGTYDVSLRIENERGEISTTTQRIAVSAAPSTGMGTVSILVSGQNGEAVPNAQVAIAGQTLTTDASGALSVGSVPIGPAFVARVTKAGFAPSIVRGKFAEGASEFTLAVLLTATDTPAIVDLAQAIDQSNNGLRLRIPAGSLADASGNPAIGTASLYISSDSSNTLTYGIKHGTEMLLPNGSTAVAAGIKPFDIVIMQGNTRLNLLPGKTAQLDWDLGPTAAGDPLPDGTQLELRTLDENSGLWRQEGVATVVNSPAGNRSIRAFVGHFSYWDPTAAGSSDLISIIPSCEINIEGGLPVLNTVSRGPYCSFSVQYDNPLYSLYPGLVPPYYYCWPGSFLQECRLPRGTAYKVIARLGLDANTVLVQEQSFVANTERPVVRFASSALRPVNPDAITISAKGGNVMGERLYANGEVELKANFRSPYNFNGDVQFITGANDSVLGKAPLDSPNFILDASQWSDGIYEIRARIPVAGGGFRTSSNAIEVVLDDTPPTVVIRNPNSPNDPNLSINNATGIPIDAALRIDSSEPFDRTPTVLITPNVLGVLSKTTENAWVFTPQGNWQTQTNYTVKVTNVTDRAGNPSSAYEARFQTAAGQSALNWSAENNLQPAGFLPNARKLSKQGLVMYRAGLVEGGNGGPLTIARLDGSLNTSAVIGTMTGVGFGLNDAHADITGNRAVFAERPAGTNNLNITAAEIGASSLNVSTVLTNSTVFTLGADQFTVATNAAGEIALAYTNGGVNSASSNLFVRVYKNGAWQAPVQMSNAVPAGGFRVSVDSASNVRLLWTAIDGGATPYRVVLSTFFAVSATSNHLDLQTSIGITPSLQLLSNASGATLAAWQFQTSGRQSMNASLHDANGFGYLMQDVDALAYDIDLNASGLAAAAYSRRSTGASSTSRIVLVTRSSSAGAASSVVVRDYANEPTVLADDRIIAPKLALSNSGKATVGGIMGGSTSDWYQIEAGNTTLLPAFTAPINRSDVNGLLRSLDSGEVIYLNANRWRGLR